MNTCRARFKDSSEEMESEESLGMVAKISLLRSARYCGRHERTAGKRELKVSEVTVVEESASRSNATSGMILK